MPHKVVAKDFVKKLSDTVAYYEQQIARIKKYASGEKEGLKEAFDTIREYEFDVDVKKNQLLQTGKADDANLARLYLGKQQAFQDVLTLFEAPADMVKQFEKERDAAQSEVEKFDGLEQR